ncbi:MAG: lysophospholipid acyltransferase family protein [Rhizobiaceae bacterium]
MTIPAGFRYFVGIPVLVLATAVMAPAQLFAMARSRPLARRIPVIWHRLALKIIGVRVNIHGEVPRDRPLLIVANHVSWSDIMVLGSVMELCFIAKSEVRFWPGINWLARMQRTVFVDREKRNQAGRQADSIAARLAEGDAMVLFAEGTTGDGHRLQPFKSALFGALHGAIKQTDSEQMTVQPVALGYTRLHGLPLGRLHQARAAWPGDVELGPHLLTFLRNGAYDVEVVFGQPAEFSAETNRKTIARDMQHAVRQEFSKVMRMRKTAELLDRSDGEG